MRWRPWARWVMGEESKFWSLARKHCERREGRGFGAQHARPERERREAARDRVLFLGGAQAALGTAQNACAAKRGARRPLADLAQVAAALGQAQDEALRIVD